MAVTVRKCGSEWIVGFPYSREYVEKIRSVGSGRYNPKGKTWHFNAQKDILGKIRQAFAPENIQVILEETRIENNCETQHSIDNSKVLDAYHKELVLKGFSHKTQKAYMGHVRRFLSSVGKVTDDILENDASNYVYKMIENEKVSFSYANQMISALTVFYECILKKSLVKMSRPKKEEKLPQVLSQQEVLRILECVENPKHRTMMYVVYAAGLRVSEVVRLKTNDIDRQRKLIRIQQSKGRKDRYVMLSEIALQQIDEYCKLYKPETWLFQSGVKIEGHLSERSIQKVFERACDKADVQKDVGIHVLRHYVELHIIDIRLLHICWKLVQTFDIFRHS